MSCVSIFQSYFQPTCISTAAADGRAGTIEALFDQLFWQIALASVCACLRYNLPSRLLPFFLYAFAWYISFSQAGRCRAKIGGPICGAAVIDTSDRRKYNHTIMNYYSSQIRTKSAGRWSVAKRWPPTLSLHQRERSTQVHTPVDAGHGPAQTYIASPRLGNGTVFLRSTTTAVFSVWLGPVCRA